MLGHQDAAAEKSRHQLRIRIQTQLMDGCTEWGAAPGTTVPCVVSSHYSNFSGGAATARRVGVCLTRMPTYTLMHTNANMKAPRGRRERLGVGGVGVFVLLQQQIL